MKVQNLPFGMVTPFDFMEKSLIPVILKQLFLLLINKFLIPTNLLIKYPYTFHASVPRV